jgi:hypothetical protein
MTAPPLPGGGSKLHLFPRSSTCRRVFLSWFHTPRGTFLSVDALDIIPAVRNIAQQRILTNTISLSLSLSPQFSLTRGKKFNGILERETRQRKGLVQLLPKVINLILNFTVFHWLSSCSAKLQFLILFFSSLLWSLNCFLIFSYNN